MSQISRPLVAAFSLVGLWFLAMVLETLRVPVWALVMNGGLLLVNVIVLTAAIHDVTRQQYHQDGDGGLPPRRPDLPDPGGGGEPTWWPEFERALAKYLAEDERPQPVPVGSLDATWLEPPTPSSPPGARSSA